MKEPRNPFRLRASENIESDSMFLRLFSPGMLDILASMEQPWDRVQILRSAPGGGKTSLMRLFTPSVLLTLHAYRTSEEYKDLYQRMRALGAFSDVGPQLLGVMLSCARNYSTLADLQMDGARKERLLFGLLNARLVLATLRGSLALRKLEYPDDLGRLQLSLPESIDAPPGLRFPCTGTDLYRWARELEAAVYEVIDSFSPQQPESVPGHDTLISLMLLGPHGIRVDGAPVAERIVILLDDVHKLTRQQRERLIQNAVDMRSPLGVWIAERFEALSTTEMLSSGAVQGRDYGRVTLLEGYWRDNRSKKFEGVVSNIADRRARAASEIEVSSFASTLQGFPDGSAQDQRIARAAQVVEDRVRKLADANSLFREWLLAREQVDGTPWERATAWRSLEILVHREKRKAQGRLDFVALTPDELRRQDDPGVRAAAELFLAREFGLPYYCGAARLSAVASSNIQQFLSLAGNLFEEAVSAALIKRPTELSPDRQEAILKKAARARWEDITRTVPNGREVKAFLEATANFARWTTYQPNAPYAPGVAGIAISMADRDRLRDPKYLEVAPDYVEVARVLASALAHNLLEPVLDHKCKGEYWLLLHLNRLLCVHFGLPLQYSGWREKSLGELHKWLRLGFSAPTAQESLL